MKSGRILAVNGGLLFSTHFELTKTAVLSLALLSKSRKKEKRIVMEMNECLSKKEWISEILCY